MEYTEKEKQIAKAIVKDTDYIDLIKKVFLSTEDAITTEVVREKTNEQLGEIVRANLIAEEKIKQAISKLKQIGGEFGGSSLKVPR